MARRKCQTYCDAVEPHELESLSFIALGLWHTLRNIAATSSRPGYLSLGGLAVTPQQYATSGRCTEAELTHAIQELQKAGLLANAGGQWFMPQIQDAARISQVRRQSGSGGGNPHLVNQNGYPNQLTKPDNQNAQPKSPPPSLSPTPPIPPDPHRVKKTSNIGSLLNDFGQEKAQENGDRVGLPTPEEITAMVDFGPIAQSLGVDLAKATAAEQDMIRRMMVESMLGKIGVNRNVVRKLAGSSNVTPHRVAREYRAACSAQNVEDPVRVLLHRLDYRSARKAVTA